MPAVGEARAPRASGESEGDWLHRHLERIGALAAGPLRTVRRWLRDPIAPVIALCLILVVSLALRWIDLQEPCQSPCKTPASHTLIFDESYYVNAARVIDHINPPAGDPYHDAPFGEDPNAEHPQLAKLIIAGTIELFGDDPVGWRIGSVLFGLIALVALYALVRGAGGSGWLAAGAVGIAALDNLLLVHSRIGTLDIYALAMMIIAAALYVRRRPLTAGVALGIGMCMKEVALYLLLVFVIFEGLRFVRSWWLAGRARGWVQENLRPLGFFIGATAVSFFLLLWILDLLVPAYDTGTHITYGGDPFTHFWHMVHYATLLKSQPGKPGIASTPFQWLLNEKAIPYAKTAVNTSANGHILTTHNQYFFQGLINPFIIFLAVPAVLACLSTWWRRDDRIALIGVAWFLGTFLPPIVESYGLQRVNYIYYMLIVMPAIYIALARVFGDRRMPRLATVAWVVMLVFGFADLYPIRTLL